jgi:hypothetical protein
MACRTDRRPAVTGAPPPAGDETPDLLAALQASVDQARLAAQARRTPPAADESIPDPDDAPADWEVTGTARAARTLARCRLLRAELAEVRALAQAEIDRWQTWASAEDARITSRLSWYEAHLEAFAQEARRRDPENGKTVNLPGGRISTKEQAGKWVVDPEAALASAAELRPDLIEWRPRFDLATAKRTLKVVDGQIHDTRLGVVIEGITPEPDRIAVTITYTED